MRVPDSFKNPGLSLAHAMQRDVTDVTLSTKKGRFFEETKCHIRVTPRWHGKTV